MEEKPSIATSTIVLLGGLPFGVYSCIKHELGLGDSAMVLGLIVVSALLLRARENNVSIFAILTGGKPSNVFRRILLPAYVLYTIIGHRWSHPETGLAAAGMIAVLFFIGEFMSMKEGHDELKAQGFWLTPFHFLLAFVAWRSWRARFVLLAIICMFVFEPDLTRRAAASVWDLLWGPIPSTR
jgi:hypothetical protein